MRPAISRIWPIAITCALTLANAPALADIYRSVQPNGVAIYTNMARGPGYKLFMKETSAARAPQAARQSFRLRADSRAPFASSIRAAGLDTAVDPALIHAVIRAESGYNPSARSSKGAAGLMQLMPETARRYGVVDRFDPVQNIRGGSRYLRDLLRLFNNDTRLALAAYNAGEDAVFKYGNRIPPYRETVAYVPRVMNYYRQYRAAS